MSARLSQTERRFLKWAATGTVSPERVDGWGRPMPLSGSDDCLPNPRATLARLLAEGLLVKASPLVRLERSLTMPEIKSLLAKYGVEDARGVKAELVVRLGKVIPPADGMKLIEGVIAYEATPAGQAIIDELDAERKRLERAAEAELDAENPLDFYRKETALRLASASGIVDAWTWLTTLEPRSCPLCLARHGNVYAVGTPFEACHPGCRCVMAPSAKGFSGPPVRDSDAWFAGLAPEIQSRMLGPDAFTRWRESGLGLKAYIERFGWEPTPEYVAAWKDTAKRQRKGVARSEAARRLRDQ